MAHLDFSSAEPEGFASACRETGSLFGHMGWQALLASSFGAETVYGWNGSWGAAISVFRVGPFRIGYLGFPLGNCIGTSVSLETVLAEFRRRPPPIPLTCLRIPVSAFPGTALPNLANLPNVSGQSNPETAITDLRNWDPRAIRKRVRRIKKAERSGMTVELAHDVSVGAALYQIYAKTVRRHGGSIRYNERYFVGLVELSRSEVGVNAFVGYVDSEVAGFVVTATHGETTYYLHGGTVDRFRDLSPSDLVMASAIEHARANDSTCFNFMASPPDQPSLVRYKEKWGGETRTTHTLTLAMSPLHKVFKTAAFVHGLWSRVRS